MIAGASAISLRSDKMISLQHIGTNDRTGCFEFPNCTPGKCRETCGGPNFGKGSDCRGDSASALCCCLH